MLSSIFKLNGINAKLSPSSRSGSVFAAALTSVFVLSAALPQALAGEASKMTAQQSDPRSLNLMTGFPPVPDKIIRLTDPDYFSFPKLRWTVCHFRELMPTVNVSRGIGAPALLEEKSDPAIDALTFTPLGSSETMTWAQSLEANYTDGIIVLHKGTIIYEHYSGCLNLLGQHGAMSVTKSITGLLGEMLVAEGALDESAKVSTIVPELKDSAFGDATIRQVMDMTTGLKYSEDYADPNADVWAYSAAGSPLPKPENYQGPETYYEYLQMVQKQGEHGDAFGYKTINSDALGWIIARSSGKSVATLLSEKIWQKMGAEQDAYYTVDSIGTPFAGGGFNAGLRDMARLGQLLLNDGVIDGQRLIPAAAIASIRGGGDKEAFAKAGYSLLKGWTYRGMWWISHNEDGAYMARGVHGQALYIDPKAEMVIARFASHPQAGNAANDPTSLPAYEAVAQYLLKRDISQ